MTRRSAAERGVDGLVSFRDPDDNYDIELFWGLRNATDRFVSPIGATFVAGDLGLGHAFQVVRDEQAYRQLYFDLLGFRLSDHIDMPGGVAGVFTALQPPAPLVRLRGSAPNRPIGIGHLMLEVDDLDVIGRNYDKVARRSRPDPVDVRQAHERQDDLLLRAIAFRLRDRVRHRRHPDRRRDLAAHPLRGGALLGTRAHSVNETTRGAAMTVFAEHRGDRRPAGGERRSRRAARAAHATRPPPPCGPPASCACSSPGTSGAWSRTPWTSSAPSSRSGSHDPSAGWVAGVVGVHPHELAHGDRRVQEEVWAKDPDTWVASPYAPMGRARPVEGGYIFNGRWNFSSGTDHCQWVMIGGLVTDQEGNVTDPAAVHFLLPRSDYEIVEDSWDVMGLRGHRQQGPDRHRRLRARLSDHRDEGCHRRHRRQGPQPRVGAACTGCRET